MAINQQHRQQHHAGKNGCVTPNNNHVANGATDDMRKNTAMMSHDKSEYDFGFVTVKLMKYLGLVKATAKGADIPKDVQLTSLNFSWVSVSSR